MSKYLSLPFFLALCLSAFSQNSFTSVQNGDWDDESTWFSGGGAGGTEGVDYPSPFDSVFIDHDVLITATNSGSDFIFEGFLQINAGDTLECQVGSAANGFVLQANGQIHNFGAFYTLDNTQNPDPNAHIEKEFIMQGNSFFIGYDNSFAFIGDDWWMYENAMAYLSTNVCYAVSDDFNADGTDWRLFGNGDFRIGGDGANSIVEFTNGASIAQISPNITIYRNTSALACSGDDLATGTSASGFAPIAYDDFYTTGFNTAINLNVLYQGQDDETIIIGDTLTITSAGSNVAADDNTTDQGGTLSINNNGTASDLTDDYIVYTPAANFTGTDSFDYIITNEDGETDQATVTIYVTCDGGLFAEAAADFGLDLGGAKDGGLTWYDLNRDDLVDVIVNTSNTTNDTRIYFQQSDGTFADVTSTHAPALLTNNCDRTALAGDMNNDGYVEFVRNSNNRLEIWQNNGPSSSPAYSFALLEVFTSNSEGINIEGVAFVDWDQDGFLDLIMDNDDSEIVLYENDQDGTFTEITAGTNLPTGDAGVGDYSSGVDWNNDGFIDFVGRKSDAGTSDFWQFNGGTGQFDEVTNPDLTTAGGEKGAVTFCDLDQDGDLDFIWAHESTGDDVSIYTQGDDGSFTFALDLVTDNTVEECDCADVDNDGDNDIFLGDDAGASYLYKNGTSKGGALAFVQDNDCIDPDDDVEGAEFVDFDNDGDMDLYMNIDGAANQLWVNAQNDEDYLIVEPRIQLDGSGNWRSAIGANVMLIACSDTCMIKDVSAGRGHGSQKPSKVHFGLGGSDLFGGGGEYSIAVFFPDENGTRDTVVKTITPSSLSNNTLIVYRGSSSDALCVGVDSDGDGTPDSDDEDDDNDGVLDINECLGELVITTETGFFNSANLAFTIAGNVGVRTDPQVLQAIAVAGTNYNEFILPDSFDINYTSGSFDDSDARFLDGGVSQSRLSVNGEASFETTGLLAFQDADLNHYQMLDTPVDSTADFYDVYYDTPILSNGRVYVAFSERGGNNQFAFEAFAPDGTAYNQRVELALADYIDSGFPIAALGGGGSQNAEIAVLPITDLAPIGSTIGRIRSIPFTSGSDAGDGKVFIFGVTTSLEGSCDSDGDGVENGLDLDSDNDGIPDLIESGGVDTDGDGLADDLTDSDGDGIADVFDGDDGGNPLPNLDSDNDGVYDKNDLDSDDDGIADLNEGGGTDENGDGRVDDYVDTDSDGFGDIVDGDVGNDGTAENSANAIITTGADIDNDGRPDSFNAGDFDNDDVPNHIDIDSDNDGISDVLESGQADVDSNGRVDNYSDVDNDGFSDLVDGDSTNVLAVGSDVAGNNTANAIHVTDEDADLDGRPDSYPSGDSDGDDLRDFTDLDADNDGIPDIVEAGGEDTDGNGIVDDVNVDGTLTTDSDGDGLADVYDADNSGTSITNPDTDNDGVSNYLDLDSDNDGILDVVEAGGTADGSGRLQNATTDTDNDGFGDSVDGDVGNDGTSENTAAALTVTGDDTDNDGRPDSFPNDDTDGDGLYHFIDIDADGDGIIDNIEAQITTATVEPSNSDGDGDGLDDNFENNGLAPIDTDSDGTPDYLDEDSDDDGITDNVEGWDTDGDGIPDTTPTYTDTDGDGLDEGYDDVAGPNPNTNPSNGGQDGINLANADEPSTPERDWRELQDNDNDGIADINDIDDDNDGILDTDEGCSTPSIYGGSRLSSSNVQGAGAGINAPNGVFATFTSGANFIMDFGSVFELGTQVFLHWREAAGQTGTANMLIEYSIDNANYFADSRDFETDDLVIENDTFFNQYRFQYIRMTQTGSANLQLDALGISQSDVCEDFDGDGVPNNIDLDSDNDGIPDIVEAGGTDANGDGIVDGVFADTDNDGHSNEFDTTNAGTSLPDPDTDGDGFNDRIDIDADNDGIVDVIEAQPSGAITVPSGVDSDGDGIDDEFDPDSGNALLVPTNTDGTDEPDYLDQDSDNDRIVDLIEAYDTDGDGQSDLLPTGTDSDNDGLDDAYDNITPINDSTNVHNGGQTSASFPNDDLASTPERDWREASDVDNDGTPDIDDIDNDNDGVVDTDEGCTSTESYVTTTVAAGGVSGLGNIRFAPNNGFAAFINNGSTATIDYGTTFGVGSFLIFTWRERAGQTGTGTAQIEYSLDNSTYFVGSGRLVTNNTSTVTDTLLSEYSFRFIRIRNITDADTEFDAVELRSSPSCVDSDGDGINDNLDLDADGDGIPDLVEAGGVDTDGDGQIDDAFVDSDNDGLHDTYDGDNGGNDITNPDTDGDGVSDIADIDSDNDGIPDVIEAGGTDVDEDGREDGTGADIDEDGLDDGVDGDVGNDGTAENTGNAQQVTGTDTDNDGAPNSYPNDDSDGDGFTDQIDIDADNDGIVDNTEAQTTSGYAAPSGADTDGDGLDDSYDPDCAPCGGVTGVYVTPEDTDSDSTPDYLDDDSDNDGDIDVIEGHDTDNDNVPDAGSAANTGLTGGATDADGDGLLDGFDNNTSSQDPTNGGFEGGDYPNNDDPITTEADWREILDSDDDGVADNVDIDDDNDGIPDTLELACNPSFVPIAFSTNSGINVTAPLNNVEVTVENGTTLLDVTELGTGQFQANSDGTVRMNSGTTPTVATLTFEDEVSLVFSSHVTSMSGNFDANDRWRVYAFGETFTVSDPSDHLTDTRTGAIIAEGDMADTVEFFRNAGGVGNNLDWEITTTPARTFYIDFAALSGTNIGQIRVQAECIDVDSDGDGIVDRLDLDSDNDGIPDIVESGGVDTDGNGRIDGAFADNDGDGLHDTYDTDDGGDDISIVDTDNDGLPDVIDLDSDNDGIPDVVEAGGTDIDGDGYFDDQTDTDSDGLADDVDGDVGNDGTAENTANALQITGIDTDNDGIPNSYPAGDSDGDGLLDQLDLDSDNDGIPDVVEVGGTDTNGDGYFDNQTDTDSDGLADDVDGDVGNDGTAENTADALQITGADTDDDGAPNSFPSDDFDDDGVPNQIDIDSDDDGITDVVEAGGTDADENGRQDTTADTDGDGLDDAVDGDVGNDGTAENSANAQQVTGADTDNDGAPNSYPEDDSDSDGLRDQVDIDADNDGITDNTESQTTVGYVAPSGVDTDGDGLDDSYDPDCNPCGGVTGAYISPENTESTGLPDYLDSDSDDDGEPDALEGHDSDGDGTADGSGPANSGLPGGVADADMDGLLDGYDNNTSSTDPTNGGISPSSHPNADGGEAELDWREVPCDGGSVVLAPNNATTTANDFCTENGFTYYYNPSDPTELLFAIEHMPVGGNTNAFTASVDLTVSSAPTTSAGVFSSENIGAGEATFVMGRYFNISITSGSLNGNVNIRFYYDTDEADTLLATADDWNTDNAGGTSNVSGLRWFTMNSGTFDPGSADLQSTGIQGSSEAIPTATSTEDGVAFSQFSLSSLTGGGLAYTVGTNSVVLPVKWFSFDVSKEGDRSHLVWFTASEKNTDEFIVERSTPENKEWKTIARVKAAGQSQDLRGYDSYDENPEGGLNYYRIKQVDFDQSFDYSEVKSLYFVGGLANSTVVFPNPNAGEFTVQFSNPMVVQSVSLLSSGGQLVKAWDSKNFGAGNIKVRNISAGTYILRVIANDEVQTMRVVVSP